MQLNNQILVDRQNRPQNNQNLGLRCYFINDGQYVDPYEISSVTLFKKSDIIKDNIFDTENLVSAVPLMAFANAGATQTSLGAFDEANYTQGVTASGIHKKGTGDFVVALDQSVELSGWDATTSTVVAASGLSLVEEYADIWAVKLTAASKYQLIINYFTLHEDTFMGLTEPLALKTSNKLINKHLRLGEIVDLKITTEVAVMNSNIPEEITNIFKDSVINNASVEIKKVNSDHNFDGPFTVSGYDGTAALTTISSDNTISLSFDTNNINSLAAFTNGSFGSLTGLYSIQAKYLILNQTIISPLYYLTVS
jgi:hypothetical protein